MKINKINMFVLGCLGIALTASSFITNQAVAQSNEAPKNTTEQTVEPQKNTSELHESSETIRDLNPFYVAGQVSLWTGVASGFGGKVGWRSARWALEGQFNRGSNTSDNGVLFFGPTEKVRTVNNSYSLDGKFFPGNSFYLGGGLSYENRKSTHYTVRYRCNNNDDFICDSNPYDVEDGHENLDLLSGQVFIGNQWEISHVTIGADWIGIGAPIAVINRSTDGARPPNSFSNFELYLLRIYAGVSF